MIPSLQSYVHRSQQLLRALRTDPRLRTTLRIAAGLAAGFVLSAASLLHHAQPLALAAVCACGGWTAVWLALGSAAGYLLLWGAAGAQCALWLPAGLALALALCDRPITRAAPGLLSAAASVVVAVTGVILQIFSDTYVPISVYLLRTLLAGVATFLFSAARTRKDPISRWLCCGFWVLALAQLAPLPWLGLGFVAAGALGAVGALPAAAVAGLALDLAQITRVPMAAVLCLTYFMRLIPNLKKWMLHCAPGIVYLAVMALCGKWELMPLPALLLGGFAGMLLPQSCPPARRRGETGIAQVRLEMASNALSQTQQLLMQLSPPPVDEQALICRTAERACGSCSCRKACPDREAVAALPGSLLHSPLLDSHDLPFVCRKSGRLLTELHRTQEQLRAIRADRHRQAEYRSAVIQQYGFLSAYLQDLSDTLGSRATQAVTRYQPKVCFCANRPQGDNGDRCLQFAGVGGCYYVALCDGMGTGLGAVEEGRSAGQLLRKMLCAGYPAEHALRSLNSLCALRGAAGAVTVDLAELQLDTGKVFLYKWGAAPSYLLTATGCEKIGTAGPPPGLSVTDSRESVDRLSLRRGQTLVLLSDGVGGEDALRCCFCAPDEPLGELAARILELGTPKGRDDATVAVIRLHRESPYAS